LPGKRDKFGDPVVVLFGKKSNGMRHITSNPSGNLLWREISGRVLTSSTREGKIFCKSSISSGEARRLQAVKNQAPVQIITALTPRGVIAWGLK